MKWGRATQRRCQHVIHYSELGSLTNCLYIHYAFASYPHCNEIPILSDFLKVFILKFIQLFSIADSHSLRQKRLLKLTVILRKMLTFWEDILICLLCFAVQDISQQKVPRWTQSCRYLIPKTFPIYLEFLHTMAALMACAHVSSVSYAG